MCSGKFIFMENRQKLKRPITRCFLKTDKSWIDYRALTKIGLSANIDRPYNNMATVLIKCAVCPPTTLFLSESGSSSSPHPRKNGYRKNDYIVDCPDLIELFFCHSPPHHPTPPKIGVSENFGMAIAILRNGTRRNGIDEKHLME